MPPELTKQVKRHPIFHALVTSSTEITYNNPDLILHRGLFDEVAIVRSSQNSQFPDCSSSWPYPETTHRIRKHILTTHG
jgi:hypothetical protein